MAVPDSIRSQGEGEGLILGREAKKVFEIRMLNHEGMSSTGTLFPWSVAPRAQRPSSVHGTKGNPLPLEFQKRCAEVAAALNLAQRLSCILQIYRLGPGVGLNTFFLSPSNDKSGSSSSTQPDSSAKRKRLVSRRYPSWTCVTVVDDDDLTTPLPSSSNTPAADLEDADLGISSYDEEGVYTLVYKNMEEVRPYCNQERGAALLEDMISTCESMEFNVGWLRQRLDIIKVDRDGIIANVVPAAKAILEEEKALAAESEKVEQAIQNLKSRTERYQERLKMMLSRNYNLLDGLF
ncbi:hypothetical protein C5167_029335 [Papaver somniferum]|nr:hypothetical protein C5167_029335 [Papaver somniferum]